MLAARIEVTPVPQMRSERTDVFGNRVTRIRIDTPHRELVIKAISRVQVDRPAPPLAALTPPWESVTELAAATGSLGPDSPAFAIYPSRLAALFDAATDYARDSFSPGRPIYEASAELSGRIHRDFSYDSKATEVDTPPAEAFARRRGVCQDFAHVMIAALRGLGLPALYVSGYIRTIPPAGKPGSPARMLRTPGSAMVRTRLRLVRPRSDERDSRGRRSRRRRSGPRLRRRAAGRRRCALRRADATSNSRWT